MTTKINKTNFPEGIDLWVSSAITSKKTGKTVYWCSIDQYESGALLYMAHSVYEGLTEVNANTVVPRLLTGKFEISPARDINTGEQLLTEDGEEIYMVNKSREVVHGAWE